MPVFRPLLISAVLGSLTLVGCAQPNGKPIIAFMKNSQPLSGKWYGQATCSNGEVSKLSLDVNGTASGKLSGALAISQSNNRSGVYSFNGQFEQDATLRLTPVQWQQKTGNPSNLALTGKADDVNQPTVIRGNVPECGGTFELGRKQSAINTQVETKRDSVSSEKFISKWVGAKFNDISVNDGNGLYDKTAPLMQQIGFNVIAYSNGKKGYPSGPLGNGNNQDKYKQFDYVVGEYNKEYWVLIYSRGITNANKNTLNSLDKFVIVTDLVRLDNIDITNNNFYPDNEQQGCGIEIHSGKKSFGDGVLAILPSVSGKKPKKMNGDIDLIFSWNKEQAGGRLWKLNSAGKIKPLPSMPIQINTLVCREPAD